MVAIPYWVCVCFPGKLSNTMVLISILETMNLPTGCSLQAQWPTAEGRNCLKVKVSCWTLPGPRAPPSLSERSPRQRRFFLLHLHDSKASYLSLRADGSLLHPLSCLWLTGIIINMSSWLQQNITLQTDQHSLLYEGLTVPECPLACWMNPYFFSSRSPHCCHHTSLTWEPHEISRRRRDPWCGSPPPYFPHLLHFSHPQDSPASTHQLDLHPVPSPAPMPENQAAKEG